VSCKRASEETWIVGIVSGHPFFNSIVPKA
jgi:hypothetical protein